MILLIEDFPELYLDRFRQDAEQVFGDRDVSFVGSRRWNWKFCFIQVIVFDLSYLPLAAVGT